MSIYNIIINGAVVYVGKTKNVKQRYRQHKWLLVHNKHQNKYLQDEYNKHKMFSLVVVKDNASERDEQVYILRHNTEQRSNRAEPSIDELRRIHRSTFT